MAWKKAARDACLPAVARYSVGRYFRVVGGGEPVHHWYQSPSGSQQRRATGSPSVQDCGRSCAPTVTWVALGRTQEAPAGAPPPPTQEAPRTGRLEPDE